MTIATLTAGDLAAVIAAVVSRCGRRRHRRRPGVARPHAARGTGRGRRRPGRAARCCSTELERVVSEAGDELERVDDLIGSAEALAATVDARLRAWATSTFGKPVIKAIALATGTVAVRPRRIRGTEAG